MRARRLPRDSFLMGMLLLLTVDARADDLAYLEQKCRGGEAAVCATAAEALEEVDLDRAIALHLFSCEKNTGCDLYALANRLSSKGQAARALQLLEKACAISKNWATCYALAERQRDGDGGKANPRRAAELFRQACDDTRVPTGQRAYSCSALARMHRTGIGVRKDPARADALAAKARTLGLQEVSAQLQTIEASIAGNRPTYAGWEKDCNAGKLDMCGVAMQQYLGSAPERAWELLKPACTAKAFSCGHGSAIVPLLVAAKQAARGAEILTEQCERGWLPACSELGTWLRDGDLIARNPARARSILEAACKDDEAGACSLVSEMIQEGEGGARDLPRARALLERAKQLSWTRRSRLARGEEPPALPPIAARVRSLVELQPRVAASTPAAAQSAKPALPPGGSETWQQRKAEWNACRDGNKACEKACGPGGVPCFLRCHAATRQCYADSAAACIARGDNKEEAIASLKRRNDSSLCADTKLTCSVPCNAAACYERCNAAFGECDRLARFGAPADAESRKFEAEMRGMEDAQIASAEQRDAQRTASEEERQAKSRAWHEDMDRQRQNQAENSRKAIQATADSVQATSDAFARGRAQIEESNRKAVAANAERQAAAEKQQREAASEKQARDKAAAVTQKRQDDEKRAAAERQAAERKENDRKTALAACMTRPVSQMRTAQTNPFESHAQGYERLIGTAQKCPASPTPAWQECIGANSLIWPDVDARRDFDDYVSRSNRVATGGGCGMGMIFDGVRSYCHTMSAENCLSNLRSRVSKLRCARDALPRVWEAEIARNQKDAERQRDQSCHQQFD